jgi:hypothetical protein
VRLVADAHRRRVIDSNTAAKITLSSDRTSRLTVQTEPAHLGDSHAGRSGSAAGARPARRRQMPAPEPSPVRRESNKPPDTG